MKLVRIISTFALLAAACGESSSLATTGIETVVDTVAGVIHIRSSGTAPAWAAEPVVRLGSIQAGPEQFGRIRSLVANAQGDIYIADNLAREIRVFTSEGRHVRSIGRHGAGPGEFRDLYALAWMDGDLAAMDPGNARIGILSSHGEWVKGIRHFPISGPPSVIRLHPLADDGFYAPIIDVDRNLPFVRIATAGARDTIQAPQSPAGATRTLICERPDGGIVGIAVPQAPRIVYAFPPPGGEIAVSWTEAYRIAFIDPPDDTLRVVTRERSPVPYTDALWEEGTRHYRELHEDYPGTRCEPSAPERPAHRAFLRQILFDEEGRMWVEAAIEHGFLWEVFDPQGRLLGAAPAPPRLEDIPPYVRNGHLYQVETDELDVQYVAAYRISPQGSSSSSEKGRPE